MRTFMHFNVKNTKRLQCFTHSLTSKFISLSATLWSSVVKIDVCKLRCAGFSKMTMWTSMDKLRAKSNACELKLRMCVRTTRCNRCQGQRYRGPKLCLCFPWANLPTGMWNGNVCCFIAENHKTTNTFIIRHEGFKAVGTVTYAGTCASLVKVGP
jgi:hypothetical protein